ADLLGSAGDLAFVLDADGVIRDVAVTAEDIARIGVADWIGRRWIDTVGIDSRPKVEEIMASVAAGQSGHWRQLNHPTDSGDVPVRYLAVPLSGKRL
ncbi:PAS domain-containing protein, partial [Streptococcus suis]